MRWNAMVVGLTLVLGAAAGCQRDTFLTKDEYAAYIKNNNLPSSNDTDEQQQGLQSFQNGQTAQMITSLVKPLPTGGFAGITLNTTYQNLSNPPTGSFSLLNPSYTSRLQFQIEQPLLVNAGVDVNQLLPTPVPSTLFGQLNNRRLAASGPIEGIVVSRIRFDQQRAEFERNLNWLVV